MSASYRNMMEESWEGVRSAPLSCQNNYPEECARCGMTVDIHVADELASHTIGDTHITPRGVIFVGSPGMSEAVYCARCAPGVAICRICGCTDEVACEEGCEWIEPNLCSSCRVERAA